VETWTGGITPGLLERGARIEESLKQPLEHHESARVALARRLKRCGELDLARAMLEELEGLAATRGDEIGCAFLLWRLGTLEWLSGRWQRALERATSAQELAEQAGQTLLHVWAQCLRALIESDLGLVEQARASGEQALACAHASAAGAGLLCCRTAAGHLELTLGNLEAAGWHFRGVSEQLRPEQLNDPTDTVWADAIETLIALGELDEPRVIIEWQEAQAQRVGGCLALGMAARGRGLLATAEGELAVGFAAFDRALQEFVGMPYPFELGRTLLGLGSAHRKARRKRAARDALEQALAVFDELGAQLWAEMARGELRRISGRRASEELTETEQRVAGQAAQGRSNKEIAAALYMSEHTVAAHLTRVYRKLGIRSRAALAHRLSTSSEGAAKV
jgi:DNA-binding CsgD family transcriptional regulator